MDGSHILSHWYCLICIASGKLCLVTNILNVKPCFVKVPSVSPSLQLCVAYLLMVYKAQDLEKSETFLSKSDFEGFIKQLFALTLFFFKNNLLIILCQYLRSLPQAMVACIGHFYGTKRVNMYMDIAWCLIIKGTKSQCPVIFAYMLIWLKPNSFQYKWCRVHNCLVNTGVLHCPFFSFSLNIASVRVNSCICNEDLIVKNIACIVKWIYLENLFLFYSNQYFTGCDTEVEMIREASSVWMFYFLEEKQCL